MIDQAKLVFHKSIIFLAFSLGFCTFSKSKPALNFQAKLSTRINEILAEIFLRQVFVKTYIPLLSMPYA